MSVDHTPLLETLGPPMRRLIRQGYSADSCIASTRIGMDVLAAMGIVSRPLTVQVVIFNAAYAQQVEKHQRLPEDVAEREAWFREFGAHSVGLGVPSKTSNGLHLVLVVEEQWVWDLSIDQASRPGHNIHLDEPLVFGVTPEFLRGEQPRHGVDHNTGAIMFYTARPQVHTYASSPNWLDDGHDAPMRERIIEAVLERVREVLSAPAD